jgi:hypothetical protein
MKSIYKICYKLIIFLTLVGLNESCIYADIEEYYINVQYEGGSFAEGSLIKPFGLGLGNPCPPEIIEYLEPIRGSAHKSVNFKTNPSSSGYIGDYIPKPNRFFDTVYLYTTPKPRFILESLSATYDLHKQDGNWVARNSGYAIESYDSFLKDTALVLDRLFLKYGTPPSLLHKYSLDDLSPDNIYEIIKTAWLWHKSKKC